MSHANLPTPRKPAPELEADLTNGTRFSLDDRQPNGFTMLVFYRGKHCPVCKTYLKDLLDRKDDFAKQGVDAVAFCMDDLETMRETAAEWKLGDLQLGTIDEETARRWGLYISTGLDDEPERFSEPGLFLVRPDGELYYAAINSMPFGRPDLGDMLEAIEFIREKDYPARGIAA